MNDRRGDPTQPNHPGDLVGPATAGPSLVASRPHARIFVGILLAFLGIGLEAIGFAIGYQVPNGPSQTINDLLLRQGLEAVAEASALALWAGEDPILRGPVLRMLTPDLERFRQIGVEGDWLL